MGPLGQGAAAGRTAGGVRGHVGTEGGGQPAPPVLQADPDHRIDHGVVPRVRRCDPARGPGAPHHRRRGLRSGRVPDSPGPAAPGCAAGQDRAATPQLAWRDGRPPLRSLRRQGAPGRRGRPAAGAAGGRVPPDPRPARAGLRGEVRARPADPGARGGGAGRDPLGPGDGHRVRGPRGIHPADADLAAMDVIAVHEVVVTYTGEAAHAAAFPHRGRNALDAAVLGYVNVAALRQHIAPGERIHSIISHGGDKPNIVPARAQSEWMVRSPTLAGLDRLKQRFVACLEAGAEAAGCEIDIGWRDVVYADMGDNQAIVERYRANAEALRRMVLSPSTTRRVVGSTDMGNVSYEVPAIHPMIQVAPPGVPIHTPAFAGFAGGPEGDQAVVDGAKALAFTVADLWLDEGLVDLARAEWEASVNVRRS